MLLIICLNLLAIGCWSSACYQISGHRAMPFQQMGHVHRGQPPLINNYPPINNGIAGAPRRTEH